MTAATKRPAKTTTRSRAKPVDDVARITEALEAAEDRRTELRHQFEQTGAEITKVHAEIHDLEQQHRDAVAAGHPQSDDAEAAKPFLKVPEVADLLETPSQRYEAYQVAQADGFNVPPQAEGFYPS